jgi:hypothetical protein
MDVVQMSIERCEICISDWESRRYTDLTAKVSSIPELACSYEFNQTWPGRTISSLHIGQTSLELAEAAAACPRDTFAARSCVGGVEGCEDIEDSEGDSRLTLRE